MCAIVDYRYVDNPLWHTLPSLYANTLPILMASSGNAGRCQRRRGGCSSPDVLLYSLSRRRRRRRGDVHFQLSSPFFCEKGDLRDLLSFPTRRSSDLVL